VEAVNSIWDARVKSAVDKEPATEAWTQAPTAPDISLVEVETTRTRHLLNTFLRRLRGLAPGWTRKYATATIEKYKVGDSQAQGRVAELAGGIMLSNDRFFFVIHLLLPGRHSLALMLPGVNARRQAWC
jgi:hypothetical protein